VVSFHGKQCAENARLEQPPMPKKQHAFVTTPQKSISLIQTLATAAQGDSSRTLTEATAFALLELPSEKEPVSLTAPRTPSLMDLAALASRVILI